ncbi:MAG: hypothetical protein IT290_01705 [Deltaproteobacteria bacterium]|nr:hypothetical protein [Deltaproteobacteria bacterium]
MRGLFNTTVVLVGVGASLLCGCAPKKTVEEKFYYPATRQLPPEPVYSRVSWSHLSHPVPLSARERTPYLEPVVSVNYRNSTLGEAMSGLAKSFGYRLEMAGELETRPVSISTTGTLEQVFAVMRRESGVLVSLDHNEKVFRVADGAIVPQLPPAAIR